MSSGQSGESIDPAAAEDLTGSADVLGDAVVPGADAEPAGADPFTATTAGDVLGAAAGDPDAPVQGP